MKASKACLSTTFLASRFLYLCIFLIIAKSPNAVASDEEDSESSTSDIDEHGCDLRKGEYWCLKTSKCVTTWQQCDVGDWDAEKCMYHYNNSQYDSQDLTYDLSSLTKEDGSYYTITSEITHAYMKYDYIFNVCKKVPSHVLPAACNTSTVGSGGESCDNDAMAYQHITVGDGWTSCWRLSDCFGSAGPELSMGLLDPVEPASGIYLLYQGGNTCPNSWADKPDCYVHEHDDDWATNYCSRSFRLNINCHGEIDEIPYEEYVEEAGGCAYEVTINHIAGCPLECPRYNGRVCSANGICFYEGYDSGADVGDDKDSSPVGCICKEGYYGSACEYEGYLTVVLNNPYMAPSPGSSLLTSAVILAIVILLYFFLVYFFRERSGYHQYLFCCCIKLYNATGGGGMYDDGADSGAGWGGGFFSRPKRWMYEPVAAVEVEDEEYGKKGQIGSASFGSSFTTRPTLEADENYGLEVANSISMERKIVRQENDSLQTKKSPTRASVLAPPTNSPSAQLARILTSSSPNPTVTPSRKSQKQDKTQTSSPAPHHPPANLMDDPLLIEESKDSDYGDERTF